jgi:hypothetical protein
MMAPEESVTMPRMAPVSVCANPGMQQDKKSGSTHASDLEIRFIIFVSVERDMAGPQR